MLRIQKQATNESLKEYTIIEISFGTSAEENLYASKKG